MLWVKHLKNAKVLKAYTKKFNMPMKNINEHRIEIEIK